MGFQTLEKCLDILEGVGRFREKVGKNMPDMDHTRPGVKLHP